jgi:integrase
MARKSTGGVVEKQTTRGTSYGIRFRAFGRRQFQHVGYEVEGTSREDAERELVYVLERVRRGEWQPTSVVEPPRQVPTFHAFASEWFESKRTEGGRRGEGLTTAGEADLRWQLEVHLLPTFAPRRLDEISVEDVDRFRRAKVREGRLNATSINKCLATLAGILELAVEYGHIGRNPAKGKRRRLPAVKPSRTYLDRADHIVALLDAAGDLDREREGRTRPWRRALLATLTLAGLRIDEALSLRWRHVDLAGGRIRVPGTKTDAAARVVDLLPLLRDELATHAASCSDRDPDALVFATRTGGKQSATNARRRILAKAVEKANVRLEQRDVEPLPVGLTPHSLRRTFASLLVARGDDPAYVMAQMGHTTPHLTLTLYAKAMQRRDGERARLGGLLDGASPETATSPQFEPAAA